jgi:hypothetical protein
MKLIYYFTIAMALSLGIVPLAHSQDSLGITEPTVMENAPLTMVSGTVKAVQDDWFFVEDELGTEWKIQVDDYTQTIGLVQPGATIAAKVEADGHAKEVKVLSNS